MRRALALLAALAVAGLSAPFAAADEPFFLKSGRLLVGSHATVTVMDACNVVRVWPGGFGHTGLPVSAQEGVDSSCFFLPTFSAGKPFEVTATDATGLAGAVYPVRACFYFDNAQFWGCAASGTVPAGASRVGIIASTGADVAWTFTIP